MDKYGADIVNSITLIEPSEIALKRAALHCKQYNSEIIINTICKKLDDLVSADFTIDSSFSTIHLMSNILDIDDYNLVKLIELTHNIQRGHNYYVCVSPYIDDIKSNKIDTFKKSFEEFNKYNLIHDKCNTKSGIYWSCNTKFNDPRTHHNGKYCCKTSINGCDNRWTRVLKVFEVYI